VGAPDEPSILRRVVRRLKRELAEGRVSIMAGGVAFYGFLALFPALKALVSIYGLLADPYRIGEQLDARAVLLPAQVREVLKTELTTLASRSAGTLCLEVAVGILLAMWAANKGTRALMLAVTAIFEPGKVANIVRVNLRALVLTVVVIVFGVLGVAAVIAVPTVVGLLRLPEPAALGLLRWLRWPLLAGLLLGGLALVYRWSCPHAPQARRRWVTAGSAAVTAAWLVGSGLFSWSVSTFTSYQRLDGSIAAFAILLTWFLLSAYLVILGAAVDAEIEAARPG
jgi:membrane protein